METTDTLTVEQAKLIKVTQLARGKLITYTRLCDPKYVASTVHHYVTDLLQQVNDGKINRLIINLPPRMGKSRLCAVELPTYYLGHHPEKSVVYASYGLDLCYRHSRQARSRMWSPYYRQIFPGVELEQKNQGSLDWGTTQGGGYRAVTIGGGLTGHTCHLMVIDDAHKDFSEAHSATIRENVWEWFLSVAYTRAPEAIVIIMTRWHIDDLVGRLLDPARKEMLEEAGAKDEIWKVVNLPAIATEHDVLGRAPGDPMFPEKWPRYRWNAVRAVQGSYKWSALFEGNPVPKGGNYINSANFNIIPKDKVPINLRWLRFWDLATSEKETADFTCGIAAAMDDQGVMWLMDMVLGQWEWPRARERIIQTVNGELDKVRLVGVEAVAGFKTAFQNLKEVMPYYVSLCECGVDKDKLTRALPWIALVENKRVNLVQGDWIIGFQSQCEAFPSGVHDDMVDAVSGAYNLLTTNVGFSPFAPNAKFDSAMKYRRARSLSG